MHDGNGDPEGPWTGGWLVAGGAALIAGFLARVVGDVGVTAALLVALVVFLVFGVLLGLFWGNPMAGQGHDTAHDDDHDHAPPTHPSRVADPVQPLAPLMALVPVAMPVAEAAPQQEAEPVAPAEPMAPREPIAPRAIDTPIEPVPTLPVSQPLPVSPVEGGGDKPEGLAGPRNGQADALQSIEGIGPVLEKLCHDLGIYHFDQIAGWGPAEIAWMDGNLKGFRGRVSRDKWVAQAKLISAVGVQAFLLRAKANDY